MSRSAQVATAVGGVALAGVGVLPFLHREPAPDSWFRLHWPRHVDEDAVLAMLRHLASSRRPNIVTFEAQASKGRVLHLVGVVKADSERLRHLLVTFLPEVLLEPTERTTPKLARAVELRLGTRERALRTDGPVEVARSIIAALAGTTGTCIVQWQLGERLAPLHVPKDSVGLPTTSRAFGQAFRYGLAPLDAKTNRALQSKVGDRGFRVTLRIGTTISEPTVAKGVLRAVIGGLRVAEAPGVHFTARSCDATSMAVARPPRRFALAINVGELTGLLAWPLGDSEFPGVTRIGSRRLAANPVIPSKGRVIGEGTHPKSRRPIALGVEDGLRHLHLLGPTGTGKTTLIENLITQDLQAGRGLVVVEPKGDLIRSLLARIPDHRVGDVVLLDPTDPSAVVGLNPLTNNGRHPELVADQLLAVMHGLYSAHWGPRTQDILHACLLTLTAIPDMSLVALPLLLEDQGFRRRIIGQLPADAVVRSFWQSFERWSDAERTTAIAPSLNKTRPLLSRTSLRRVIGQNQPRFAISEVFTHRKVLLVNLAKGELGPETAALLGAVVVAGVWQAAQARSSLDPEQRTPVHLYVDEFQDYLHLPTDLADVFQQGRSLGIGIVAAHQHLSQLPPAMKSAVLANARSRVCFQLAHDDARVMAGSDGQLTPTDFQQLPAFEAYATLVADSAGQPWCSLRTTPPSQPISDPNLMRERSNQQYATSHDDTDRAIRELLAGARTATTGTSKVGTRARTDRSENSGDAT